MKTKAYFLALIILVSTLMGCGGTVENEQTVTLTNENESTSVSETLDEISVNDVTEKTESEEGSEINYLSESEDITLASESITITEGGTYSFSGTLENGQIIVDAEDEEVQIVLSDASISCDYSAPIYIKSAEEVIITVEGDNTLSVSGDISDNADSIDGVIYAKDDLLLNGSGTLYISSDYTHGIVANDDIEFQSGNYEIVVANDGINVNDSVTIIDSNMEIMAGKDGIQVDNDEDEEKGYVYLENSDITIITGEDGINASNYIYIVSGNYTIDSQTDGISADEYVYILDGYFEITTGGGFDQVLNIITVGEGSSGTVSETDKLTDSMKAIKSNDIVIDGGTFVIDSYEDGFNANNNIVINGGHINVNSGDEAFTAKNTLEINDGTVVIENGYEGLEGVYININGGDISINVLDDGINGGESYSVVTITGGNLSVTCQGDGLDSNGDMVISGGYIVLDVTAIYVGGDGNVDVTGTLTYTGGTIVDATGATIDPTESFDSMMPGGNQDGTTNTRRRP